MCHDLIILQLHILMHLLWLSVKVKMDLKILPLTFRVIHGVAPKYLDELISVK